MRQETNKEIDLLLRRLSRRDGEGVRDAETQIDERHLDADELSSYAQNVAPPKARARYTQHLAECSTCRRLATELSLALGATTAAAPVETVTPASGLKSLLAGLFSPMVLRYAVPALGVIVVMVIGFVVMRQREARETLMARVEQPAAQAPLPNAEASPPAVANDSMSKQEAQRGAAEPNAPQKTDQERAGGPVAAGNRDERQQSKPAETADTGAESPPAAPVTVASPDEVHRYTESKVSELPVVSPTPLASLSPKANITTDGVDKSKQEEVAKRETKETDKTVAVQSSPGATVQTNEPPQNTTPERVKKAAADRAYEAKPEANTTTGLAGAGRRVVTRRRGADARDDAETRSVAGRKFRKEDGIWTDTAYDGSSRTVNMARGSEQFRALVADEPAIGKIAEQLDGEVIVVWKGRPYRIR